MRLEDAIASLGLTTAEHRIVDDPGFKPRGVRYYFGRDSLILCFPMQGYQSKLMADLRASDFADLRVVGIDYRRGHRVMQYGDIPIGWQLP
jgi:hypothetical protein